MPLDRAMVFGSWMTVMLNTAFMAGSSKQGNVFLAYVACICEVATTLQNGQMKLLHRRESNEAEYVTSTCSTEGKIGAMAIISRVKHNFQSGKWVFGDLGNKKTPHPENTRQITPKPPGLMKMGKAKTLSVAHSLSITTMAPMLTLSHRPLCIHSCRSLPGHPPAPP